MRLSSCNASWLFKEFCFCNFVLFMISDHCSLVLRKNCLSVLLFFFCIQRITTSKKLNVFIEILNAQQIKKHKQTTPNIFPQSNKFEIGDDWTIQTIKWKDTWTKLCKVFRKQIWKLLWLFYLSWFFSEHAHIVLLIYHVCPFLLSLLFSACQWTLFQIGLCKNESGCSSFFCSLWYPNTSK